MIISREDLNVPYEHVYAQVALYSSSIAAVALAAAWLLQLSDFALWVPSVMSPSP